MSKEFEELVKVMARLRAPGGCPWDREQTYESLGEYLLEECYEAYDAIQETAETGDTQNLREELGDVLLQVVFHSTIAAEKGDFTIDDVAESVRTKLILRHPHVFKDKKLETADDVLDNWDELKKDERKMRGSGPKGGDSILDEVPVAFPALIEGNKISKKAAKTGFDWENTAQIFDKLDEEVSELKEAIEGDSSERQREEIGDLLFVVVNLARKLGIEPEDALKKTNRKFRSRFRYVEESLKRKGKTLEDADLSEMDGLWEKAKSEANISGA
ncbi:MAG: nucleoside triphosphate pyrophosphohydrolase [Acidobacteriota bacterium]|nr:nucleoside triphosphate pyrophosphohydrolase [Acidobacteriota bacterium]MDH3528120.1 nucleoside triphosphate pyrophosphohydrolase [Acidobacteriota bacterium]